MTKNTNKPSRYRQSPARLQARRPLTHLGRNTPAWRLEHRLRQLYDMTTEEFDTLYSQQHGHCRLCREPITKTKRESARRHACIDHDHTTHRVRGLLCPPCNLFLGMFEPRQHLLPHIVAYLANSVLF